MSDRIIGINKTNSNYRNSRLFFGGGTTAKIALLAAFFATFATVSANAGLFGSNKNSKNNNNNSNQDRGIVQIQLNDFQQRNINGTNLDAYKFAQSHYGQSKAKLEQICRAISSRYNDNSARDILQKIYVIDTQIYMQNIKNSALSVSEVLKSNNAVGQGLSDLKQIIMSPGQSTLETLDKKIDQVRAINAAQLLTSQKYLACLENMTEMARASYETYEIIPSLNMNELDLFVQASKQLMTNIRSHSESFKGLVLNIKSSSEQIDSGLTGIKQTIKETLRFSDHFAIKQFPLINLPQPSREKIYVQINSLSNTVKGVDNTVSIGDSQVRNAAQQFTHLVSAFVDKSSESMKYQKTDFTEKAQTQISTYARNQVCGLFVRIKEDMGTMRTEMAQAGKANGNLQPIVNMESRSEYIARKAKSAAEDKLPLFLLGGKGGNNTPMVTAKQSQPLMKPSNDSFSSGSSFDVPEGFMAMDSNNRKNSNNNMSFDKPKSSNIFEDSEMFNEKDFASINSNDSEFMTSEMNILQQELGADFFFGGSGENISGDSILASSDEDLPSYGVDEEYSSAGSKDSAEMQVSYDNLESGSEPEIEMMRFDSSSLDSDDEETM
ncbi:MAG: hypothetical protein IKO19_13780, partial [Candidatus Riflebacteria bacterium]|nr:hypothetical protein [Candidatus Riflebacteria bacterium]